MSDWGAVHETSGAVTGGTDLEMPGHQFLTHDNLADGEITQEEIDNSVKRLLLMVLRCGLLNSVHTPDPSVVNSPRHQRLTYEVASKATVLLKNDNQVLPLDSSHIKSIAIIGGFAKGLQMGANGSTSVTPGCRRCLDPFELGRAGREHVPG